jgi:hypothetical protein
VVQPPALIGSSFNGKPQANAFPVITDVTCKRVPALPLNGFSVVASPLHGTENGDAKSVGTATGEE